MLGTKLGDPLGTAVGDDDGESLGTKLGDPLDAAVGSLDGTKDGN